MVVNIMFDNNGSFYAWLTFYMLGAYIVSYIGMYSDKINRKNDPNYILTRANIIGYYIAIVLSWAIVLVFITMALKVAFTKDVVVDNDKSETDLEDLITIDDIPVFGDTLYGEIGMDGDSGCNPVGPKANSYLNKDKL